MDPTDSNLTALTDVKDEVTAGGPQVLIVVQRALSMRDCERCGITELIRRDIDVVVVDASEVVQPKISHKRDVPPILSDIRFEIVRSAIELRSLDRLLSNMDLIVCEVGSGFATKENLPVLRWISRSRARLLLFSIDVAPNIVKSLRKTVFIYRLRAADHVTSLLNRLPLWLLGIRPADFVVYSGSTSRTPRKLVEGSTQEC